MNDNQRQATPQEAECQLYLIQNPGYDSDWVGEASKILTNQLIELSEADLVKFNALQLSIFNMIIESDKDDNVKTNAINALMSSDLNATQMRLYWIGISRGLNENIMARFLDKNIPYAKSNYAIQAISEGFTGITEYLDEFDASQIAEIYTGMKDGVNYKLYAKSEYPAEVMNLIRHAMETGLNVKLHFALNDISVEVNPVDTENSTENK